MKEKESEANICDDYMRYQISTKVRDMKNENSSEKKCDKAD